jgi:hypothetical protein
MLPLHRDGGQLGTIPAGPAAIALLRGLWREGSLTRRQDVKPRGRWAGSQNTISAARTDITNRTNVAAMKMPKRSMTTLIVA